MPDAAQTVNRFPLDLSWNCLSTPVLTSAVIFRHLINGSRLLISLILTCHDLCRDFSLTLTTLALYQRSLRRFETSSCKPVPRGHTLIFCAVTHTFYIFKVYSWHTQTYHRFWRCMIFSPDGRVSGAISLYAGVFL